jgi:hypothetical protein
MTPTDRFWAKVDRTDGCWLWTAGRDGPGYGQLKVDEQTVKAHRFSYELHVGPIPDGLELDHLCRVRHCVNPAHLEPVTHAENCRRGTVGQNMATKTHCPQGHPYEGDNLAIDRNGSRRCRACARDRTRAYRATPTPDTPS